MVENNKLKLHVYNSVFEIENEDITNLELEYTFSYEHYVKFKNGKKVQSGDKNVICFQISGINKTSKKASLEFLLDMDLDEMNKLKSKPVDITKKLRFDGPCIKRPNEDENDVINYFKSTNNIEDMFRNLFSAFIFKKDENVFIIKISIPEEKIFTYFEVDFNRKVGEN